MARGLGEETLLTSLGEVLGLESAYEDDLYGAMDWLVERQARIETKLASRYLAQETLVLYDVSSTYFEGCKFPLARRGHARDRKKGKLPIIFGLLCDTEGCPVAKALAPILFDDHDRSSAQKLRPSVVAPVQPSLSAKRKARKKRTEDDMPVHSFQTMLSDLAAIVNNRVHPKIPEVVPFDQITTLTPLQKRAFKLLGVSL